MSHNPAADGLDSAGRGNVAHDRGPMRDAVVEGTQAADRAPNLNAPNGAAKLAAQVVQEQSTPLKLLGQNSSPAPDVSRDDAVVATSEMDVAVTTQAHDSTPIHAGELNGTIEGGQGEENWHSGYIILIT